MIGWIYVMEPQDYQSWLSGGSSMGTLAENGAKLFNELACANCHKQDGSGRCPPLMGLFGTNIPLAGGGTVKMDESYIRESILQPSAKVAAGYQPIMPTFQGLVTEEGVLQLVEYIKSIGPKPATGPVPAVPPAVSTPRNR
jgi:cytochrome c oxidase subunit 2